MPDIMVSAGGGGEIIIIDSNGINSVTVTEKKGAANGSVFNFLLSVNNTVASYNAPLCFRDTLKLSANSSIRNASYTWTGPAGFTSGQQNPVIPNAGPAHAGTYVVTASNGAFSDSDTLVVAFLPSPEQPGIRYTETVCGTALNLSASTTPAGAAFSWTGPDSFRSFLSDPVIPNAVTRHEGEYSVIATIGNCHSLPALVTVSLLKGALTIHNSDTTVCQGDVITLSSSATPGYSYQWSPATGLSDPGIAGPTLLVNQSVWYTVTASYPGCPDTALHLKVNMEQNPDVQLGPDKAVCQGSRLALESVVSPYRDDYTYRWEPADSAVFRPDSPNTEIRADSSGAYRLKVSSPIGCSGTDTIIVSVYPGHFGTIVADTGYCPPGFASLWAQGGINYAWTPAAGLNDSTLARPEARPSTPTRYTVHITNEQGCHDSLNVWVAIYPDAVLYLQDSIKIYSGEKLQLEPETNCMHFTWFPPSGISDVQSSRPFVSPEVRTRYYVTAETELGCRLTDSIDILVDCGIWEVPNAFRPAGDHNRLFYPSERGYDDIRLKQFAVFNRWGLKLFETRQPGIGWDGRYQGVPQPTGVYIYLLEGESPCGFFSRTGQVTLLR